MHSSSSRGSRPTAARDAALRRLRRLTQVSIALAVALGSVFAALAAGSTHAKKTVVVRPVRKIRALATMQAPAPPLVAAANETSAGSTAPAAPAPPASAPVPSYSPPVVVSGGS